MDEQFKIDPGHGGPRAFFRVAGPILVGLGVFLFALGIIGFFAAFGSMSRPHFMWAPFVGIPLLAVGGWMCQFGYAGRVARYMAEEMAPVGKDTFNYMAEGTQHGVQTVARGAAQGLAEGGVSLGGNRAETKVRCHKCSALLDVDARFCDQCGAALAKTKPCPRCDEQNDPDARFCDNCGYAYP